MLTDKHVVSLCFSSIPGVPVSIPGVILYAIIHTTSVKPENQVTRLVYQNHYKDRQINIHLHISIIITETFSLKTW